jgi:hypothetical protein
MTNVTNALHLPEQITGGSSAGSRPDPHPDVPDCTPNPAVASSESAIAPAAAPSPALAAHVCVLALASGRSIEVTEGGAEERIQLRSTSGEVMLTVRLTDEGPVLSLSGASLEIAASKSLALSCETLHIKAARDALIEVGGSLRERVEGSVTRETAGASTVSGREVKLEAFPGGIVLKANDDVAINGERVLLNSDDRPMPRTWEEHRARRALGATRQDSEEAIPAASLEAISRVWKP